ncbi:MAG: BBE domain-containing protein, partial [Thermomicrobiales bacterium]
EGERVIAGLRALAQPIADTIAPIPYEDMYLYTDHFSGPHGASIRMMFADDLSDDSIDAALDAIANGSSPFGMFHFRVLGGAFSRVDPEATAFAHRARNLFVSIINVWLDPSEDRAGHAAWTESLWQKIRPDGEGVYVNFLESEGESRVREAYPGSTWERLSEIKATYDPQNVFRFNQNIAPRK